MFYLHQKVSIDLMRKYTFSIIELFFLEDNIEKSGSLLTLLRLPPVFVTCLITIVMAMSASYLDPTLEPHLRKSVS